MKLSQKHLYWLLQVLGWGIPFGLNAVAKIWIDNRLSHYYILVENASIIILGIVTSHSLRFLCKNWIGWPGEWSWIKLIKTVLSLLVLGFVLTFLIEYVCGWAYGYFEPEQLNRNLSQYVIAYINTVIYLVLWLALYVAITYFLRSQEMKWERLRLENMAKESQLNTLKGQVNPHFMFNSLNNIRALMLEDVDKARDMLTQLSEMLRFSLTRNNQNLVPLKEELGIVRNYIALAKIHLEDRLAYDENIEEGLQTVDVPPMLLQMLVENAVKHGVSELTAGGSIVLNIAIVGDQVSIRLTNDGQLRQDTQGTQVGVNNIKERLRLIYDGKASFHLEEQEKKVVASVLIPIS
ncbi:sensor histidine kinase [Nonlabens xiamenensis]|uniref:sensor histidine kinase n=1 Tax=Nonlabens xiamenensis TaxID=2341043 RepID=UPI000F606165|nr:histidine kinase [Nonlabens xiamenensis]